MDVFPLTLTFLFPRCGFIDPFGVDVGPLGVGTLLYVCNILSDNIPSFFIPPVTENG